MCNLWEEEAAHSNTAATHPNAPAHEGDTDFGARGHMRPGAGDPHVQAPALPVQGRVLNLDTCSPLLVRPTHVLPASRKAHTRAPRSTLRDPPCSQRMHGALLTSHLRDPPDLWRIVSVRLCCPSGCMSGLSTCMSAVNALDLPPHTLNS